MPSIDLNSYSRAVRTSQEMPEIATRSAPVIVARRRQLIVGAAALLASTRLIHSVHAQAPRRPTPSQTEGPFYPVTLPPDSDNDLLVQGDRRYTQGQPVWLDGVVT